MNAAKVQTFMLMMILSCLFVKPLLSYGCCIFTYLAVFAQQRVYISQYVVQLTCINIAQHVMLSSLSWGRLGCNIKKDYPNLMLG
jgi:hypothetical protein